MFSSDVILRSQASRFRQMSRRSRHQLNHAIVGILPVSGMQIAVRNQTAPFTGRRESLSTLAYWVSCQFDLVLRWRPRHWLTPWATLDRLWLATDSLRCHGLIIAMDSQSAAGVIPAAPFESLFPKERGPDLHPPPPVRGRDQLVGQSSRFRGALCPVGGH
jgi:hypothetical protein